MSQRDIYFNSANGRLKLRETEGEAVQLIAYERPNNAGHRTSAYRIVEIEDVEGVRGALAEALGIKAVVEKTRRLFIWGSVRIHLDEVEDLGSFIEFEAIASPGSDLSAETERVRRLREAFEIAPNDIVGGSYCDLLSADNRSGPCHRPPGRAIGS